MFVSGIANCIIRHHCIKDVYVYRQAVHVHVHVCVALLC